VIFVVSNERGPAGEFNVTQDTAEAVVGFTGLGTIDTALHYTPAPETQAEKQFSAHHLIAVPKGRARQSRQRLLLLRQST
jgi:hypothetical protein